MAKVAIFFPLIYKFQYQNRKKYIFDQIYLLFSANIVRKSFIQSSITIFPPQENSRAFANRKNGMATYST